MAPPDPPMGRCVRCEAKIPEKDDLCGKCANHLGISGRKVRNQEDAWRVGRQIGRW